MTRDARLKICETFVSIQGESSYAGQPCFFVRLTGCNLRCHCCDTTYAYSDGKEMDIGEILSGARASGVGLVEVTGGEPLLQKGTPALIKSLCDEGFSVLVETNGSMKIDIIDSRAVAILDIKTPGSGMAEEMFYGNLEILRPHDEIKFVIADRADYLWTKGVIGKFGLAGRNILLSPSFGLLSPEVLAGWIIEDRLNVRLNLQIHKYVFGDRRGV
ncbi:7-carboxy-7-deazaguanine synthase [hydrothermal vent metagenome]|uniref:7-carboxy-7-deazaguanine synthase n=1 Tax=hydrothermal vent metagenome TaxID=652676 RepID=A0A3B1CZ52_9ZZZZ